MPKTQQQILDAIISRSIDISKLEPGLEKKVLKLLLKIEKGLIADLATSNPTGKRYLADRNKSLRILIKKARKTIAAGYTEINKITAADLEKLSLSEGAWTEKLLTDSFPAKVVTQINVSAVPDALLKELSKNTLIDGATSKDWWTKQGGELLDNFTTSMEIGVFEGESLPNLLKRIKNINDPGYIGLKTLSKAQAEALVRTSVQTVTNRARESVYEANEHLLESLQWISTDDKRTTDICNDRDNKHYTVIGHKPIGHSFSWGSGPGTIHWQCRSTSVPILKDVGDLNFSEAA